MAEHRKNEPSPNGAPSLELPASELARLFKLLADESRLRILLLLMRHGELNVSTLCKQLRQNQPAVSHHLSLLKMSGAVESRREGKHNYYRTLPGPIYELLQSAAAAPSSGAPL